MITTFLFRLLLSTRTFMSPLCCGWSRSICLVLGQQFAVQPLPPACRGKLVSSAVRSECSRLQSLSHSSLHCHGRWTGPTRGNVSTQTVISLRFTVDYGQCISANLVYQSRWIRLLVLLFICMQQTNIFRNASEQKCFNVLIRWSVECAAESCWSMTSKCLCFCKDSLMMQQISPSLPRLSSVSRFVSAVPVQECTTQRHIGFLCRTSSLSFGDWCCLFSSQGLHL